MLNDVILDEMLNDVMLNDVMLNDVMLGWGVTARQTIETVVVCSVVFEVVGAFVGSFVVAFVVTRLMFVNVFEIEDKFERSSRFSVTFDVVLFCVVAKTAVVKS